MPRDKAESSGKSPLKVAVDSVMDGLSGMVQTMGLSPSPKAKKNDVDRDRPQSPTMVRPRDSMALAPETSGSVVKAKEVKLILKIDQNILDDHINEAVKSGRNLSLKDFERRRILTRSTEYINWLQDKKASQILVVDGNDPNYGGKEYSIFSSSLFDVGADIRWHYSKDPLYCFSGRYNGLKGHGNCASSLLRSICWQVLDQYSIKEVMPFHCSPNFPKDIEDFDTNRLTYLFMEICSQIPPALNKENEEVPNIVVFLIDGGNFLEDGKSLHDFDKRVWPMLRRMANQSEAEGSNFVLKVLIVFPGEPSKVCEASERVNVLDIPHQLESPVAGFKPKGHKAKVHKPNDPKPKGQSSKQAIGK